MTAKEFKKENPSMAHLKGEQLWNEMEHDILRRQQGEDILASVLPIWETHTLRWLFYRKPSSIAYNNWYNDIYSSNKRCVHCKKGCVDRYSFIVFDFSGEGSYLEYKNCSHCKKAFETEPNINISHYIFCALRKVDSIFWRFMYYIKLVKTSSLGRYDLFGDESRYCRYVISFADDNKAIEIKHIKRKWWEYFLIRKSDINKF